MADDTHMSGSGRGDAADPTLRIGVLSPVTGGFFFGEVLAGITSEVARAGGSVTLVQTLDAGQTWNDFTLGATKVEPAGWEHLDGFVAITWSVGDEWVNAARTAGKPVVLAASSSDLGVSTVVVDNQGGIRASIEHLVGHGHERIGFVGNIAQSDISHRHVAYQAAMAAHDLPALPLLGIAEGIGWGGAAAARQLAAQPPDQRCTAVIASTDRTAIELLDELGVLGIRVPEDLAIIGFDDIEASWYTTPRLTTVRQDFRAVGASSAATLLAELADPGRPKEHVVLPTELVVRASCGCPPAPVMPTGGSAGIGTELAHALRRRITAAPDADEAATPADAASPSAAVAEIERVITAQVDRLLASQQPPEVISAFAQQTVRALTEFSGPAHDRVSSALAEYAMSTTAATLARTQAAASLRRIARLSTAVSRQHVVGMGLLGEIDNDAASLGWLGPVGVRAGCLGLWTGEGPERRLRIAGVYDPSGGLAEHVGRTVDVGRFPPREVMDLADAREGLVDFLIPVRGSTGDHGLLALVAPLEREYAAERGTYDYWAALLGAALREQRMMAAVRHSEERYATAAEAANDGLWERDILTEEIYLSDRCRDLLDLPAGVVVTVDGLLSQVHPADLLMFKDALRQVEERAGMPVEVEYRRIAPDGSVHWLLTRALGVAGPDGGVVRTVGSLSDIDRRKGLEEQLRQAALYDAVTGLPNRRLFLDRLGWAVDQARRGQGRFAVVFLDLDGFKLINDSLGHLAGDELLKVVGERLRSDLRSVDTAARFGGDEFAVLLYGLKHEAVLSVVERLQERVAVPVMLANHEVSVTASVGIATSATGYTSAEDVLRDADIAMYHAKDSERGSACVFDPVMHSKATTLLRAQSELRAALVSEQFVVHYQPVVDLAGSALSQFEALVRWDHPDRGLLAPAEFLPIMAESGTIVVLGQWIIETVCAQIATWRAHYPGPVTVSINLSHREFWSDQLLLTVTGAMSRHDVPPSCLILEITESVIMSDPDAARQIMADLHATGIRMHIDDFGTGQSSLHALRAFPVDALKIDRSFISQLTTDTQTTDLVRIIVGMGRTLGLDVVAEGVETTDQADHLRTMGCDTAQGFLYAQALPGPDAGTLLGTTLTPHTAPATG